MEGSGRDKVPARWLCKPDGQQPAHTSVDANERDTSARDAPPGTAKLGNSQITILFKYYSTAVNVSERVTSGSAVVDGTVGFKCFQALFQHGVKKK